MKKNSPVLLLLFLAITIQSINAQTTFGVEIGGYQGKYIGYNKVDDITVDTNKESDGEYIIGVFAERKLTNFIELKFNLTYRSNAVSSIVFNHEFQCNLCPVNKVKIIAVNNILLSFMPQLNLPLIPIIKTKIYFGPTLTFNRVAKQPRTNFNKNQYYPGVEDVFNVLDNTITPFYIAWTYGGSIEYKRVILNINYQNTRQYTKSVYVFGKNHKFVNYWGFVNVTIGYKLFRFGKV